MAAIKEEEVYRIPVRAGGLAAAAAAWAAKGLAPAGNAFARSAGNGRLINKASRATSSCAPSAIRL